MKTKTFRGSLIVLVLISLLPLTACAPTTTLQLIQIAVNTFVGAMQVDHGGVWDYAQLTNDMSELATGWKDYTTQQKVAGANKVIADIRNAPFCTGRCPGYATVAVGGIDAAIILLNPAASPTGLSEKQRVQVAYANYRTKWNAVAPPKAKLK